MYDPERTGDPAMRSFFEEKILPELIALLRSFEKFLIQQTMPKPKLWFVYGSFARGTARAGSDIDVGIIPRGITQEVQDAWGDFIRQGTTIVICQHRVEIFPICWSNHPKDDPDWFDAYRILEL